MTDYTVRICGKDADDDGLEIDMGPVTGAWWDVPLPQCPDCGGDVVWYEAGYVPGTRRCMGEPIGGYPTNPLIDRRVPMIGANPSADDVRNGHPPHIDGATRAKIVALYRERNICDDTRVAEIDGEILDALKDFIACSYPQDGGCGSMFSVQVCDGRAHLRRERFF